MATTQQQALTTLGTEPITAEQLLEMDAKGMRGELIRGVFCPTMPTNEEHAQIVMKLGWLLGNVIHPGKLGRILGSDGGVLIETDPPTVREPDIAFISSDRRPPGTVVRNYTEIPPDLVVEIVSPSETVRGINDKARMWLDAGVRLVWVIWPETKMIEVHRPAQPVTTLRETDTLTGEDILPQFKVPIKNIFEA